MSKKKQEAKTKAPRMFYGVNAAAYLTLAEITGRIEFQKARQAEGYADANPIGLIVQRGEIQKTFVHYLRFIRALTESDV